MSTILYLHGFNSSPQSYKARMLHDYMKRLGMEERIVIPAIPPVPEEAIELLQHCADDISKDDDLALAGSSLGGFYATWLAEKYSSPAVLINPAVQPHVLLKKYLGENRNYYTDQCWVLDKSHIEQFRRLTIDDITRPKRYLLMLQTGDQTLDYREALAKYKTCPSIIEQGGSHEFSDFEKHLDKILSFCHVI